MKEKRIYYKKNDPRLDFKTAVCLAIILNVVIFYQINFNNSIEKSPVNIILACIGEVIVIWLIIYSNFSSKYQGPRIVIDTKSIQFIRLTPFLAVKIKTIFYDQIDYLGTVISKDHHESVTTNFLIQLKNDKTFTFNILQFELTHLEILEIIKEMNPEIELKSFGIHKDF